MFIFSPETLRTCGEQAGFRVEEIRTSARQARGIWTVSNVIEQKGVFSYSDVSLWSKLGGAAFLAREQMALWNSAEAGEELVLIGSRTD